MRVLVTGAGGMLGRDIVSAAPAAVTAMGLTRAELDITDEAAVRRAMADLAPEVVINCAAYTAVDRAEEEPALAHAVNVIGPGNLGRASTHHAPRTTHVVHFSTDYVFDGTAHRPYHPDDKTAPLGVYGRTKLEGERALAGSGASYTVVRTSWLYGEHGRSFPRTMLERAQAGQPTRVVDDQVGRPTYTADLAPRIWAWVQRCKSAKVQGGKGMILHASSAGAPVTWYGIARRIFERAGRAELVTPCTTAEYPTPARRPAYSVLDTSQFDAIAAPLLDWTGALDRFLDLLEADA